MVLRYDYFSCLTTLEASFLGVFSHIDGRVEGLYRRQKAHNRRAVAVKRLAERA